MNTQSIQNLFQNKYEQTQWKSFLADIFKNSMFFSEPECLIGIDKNIASSAFKLGYIVFNENGTERNIAVFEVVTAQNIILERNRVGLRNLLKKFWNDFDAAFIVYHKQNEKNWRFTFVSEIREFNAQGNYVQSSTEPKRYTYLLGEGETIKTAAQRFLAVAEKGSQISLADIKDAFSVEKLSKEFFTEYKKHYDIFCNYCLAKPYIHQTIFNGDEKAIRDFNKKLLGRIVFLFFIQKKGWLGVPDNENWGNGDLNFLNNLFNNHKHSSTFYTLTLSKLFFDTLNSVRDGDLVEFDDYPKCRIPYLNGGLFEEENTNFRNISFDGSLFKNLFEFFAKYNFTIYEDDPNDHTVAVDPEMLGHIFENLLEDNKNNGTFYTPKEIVHYMCQESLTEYLCTTLQIKDEVAEREAVNHLLKHKVVDEVLKPELAELEKALDNVKICDPAIGSGAFPMGLLQEIFSIKELISYETGKEWKPAETKLNIIQNSIYGVDIEKGAVDIARLRFWLSLVVDEEKPKPLPNLDYKIVVGDSLLSKFDGEIVEINWERKSSVGKADEYVKNVQRLLVEVADKQKKYFNPNSKNKKKLQAEIRNLKIELLINQLSFNKELYIGKTVQKGGFMPTAADIKHNAEREFKIKGFDNLITKLKLLLKNSDEPFTHFDWKLDFPEVLNPYLININSGFDIVIGNPPFIDSRTNDAKLKSFWKEKFHSAQSGKTNAYEVFIEQGLSLLKPKKRLCFIVPIVLLNLESCKTLRELLLSKFRIEEIAYGDEGVFQDANVDTMIIFISTEKTLSSSAFRINKFSNAYDSIIQTTFINHSKITAEIGFKISVKSNSISERFFNNPHDYLRISDVFDFYNGIATGPDKEKYFSFEKLNKNYKPLLMGNNIGHYHIKDEGRFINYDRPKLHRPREEKIFLADEKIIMQRIRNLRLERRLVCTLDTSRYYTFNSVNNLILKKESKYNIRYFLALLNSTLLNYLLKQQSLNTNITQSDLELLPLRKIDYKNPVSVSMMSKMVNFVDYILFLRTQIDNNVTEQLMPTYLVQILDGIVYELYFPELLKKHNREIIKHLGDLPEFTDGMSEEQKMKICKKVFDRLNDKEHPVRVNLFYMNSIPEIAIIEGKNENN